MNAAHDPEQSIGNGATDSDWQAIDAPRSVGDHARQIRHDATTLAEEVQRTAADVERYLSDRVRRRPYATLSAAAGVGYVLGGGLATRFTVVLLGIATRLATAVAMRELAGRYQPYPATSGPDTNDLNTRGSSAARSQQRSNHDN